MNRYTIIHETGDGSSRTRFVVGDLPAQAMLTALLVELGAWDEHAKVHIEQAEPVRTGIADQKLIVIWVRS